MERVNCANRQFSKENSESRNVYVNSINKIVHEICNNSCYNIYSHDLSSDHLSFEPEESVPAYQCDKPNDYVFVDVGSNLIGNEYLIEEDDDICKVSTKTLFNVKDIDYNLFKNVTIERCHKNSSKENEMHKHNLETGVFNINDIYTGSDRSGLSTNACVENICENLDDYGKKQSTDIDYITSTVVSASGSFEKVNTYVKEEKSIKDILVPQSNENMSPEIKKEEMIYNEEVSVLNESIIDIKLHPVEGTSDISTNYSCGWDKKSKTGLIVFSESVNSDFQEVHTERSEEVPDNSGIGNVMDLRSLEKNETLQNKRESHVTLQNKVQTLNRTCSELQMKPQTNSEDDTGAAAVEECNNKPNEDDVNTQAKYKNESVYQHHRKRKFKNTTEIRYVCKLCNINFTQFCDLKAHKCAYPFGCATCGKTFRQISLLKCHIRTHTGDNRPFRCDTCGRAFTQKRSLTNHIGIHTGDMPFRCDTCGKTFTQKSCLTKHIRIHIGLWPFRRDVHGNVFIKPKTLDFGCDVV